MRTASSACSASRIAPRTEVSASRLCGGTLPAASDGTETATASRASARGDDGLDLGGHAVVDLDGDHVRAGGLDRLVEVDAALVDLEAAGLLDRVDDVLRRDGSEEPAVRPSC